MQHDVQVAEEVPSNCVGSYEGHMGVDGVVGGTRHGCPWVQALGHLEGHQVLDILQASLKDTEKEKLINTTVITPFL